MDKSQFINILQHFSESSAEEAQHILSLQEEYPYSQLLHTLSARVSKDHGFSHQQTQLQMAAVYAGDRGVLKDIMTKSFEEVALPVVKRTAEPATIVREVKKEVQHTPDVPSYDLAEELIHDLERLNELKHNFEMMFVDVPETAIKTSTVVTETKASVVNETKASVISEIKKETTEVKEESGEKQKESLKSKRARIIELAKALQSESEKEHATPTPHRKGKKENGDMLIEEIESTKDEIEPAGEKQKEQMEIIDQFIKIQPSITSQKEKLANAPEGDLSTIKNGEFGDNIVSETLVEILLKQGKKDKAIEVLKKLIWKFPQKKAYFAAQIEDLKK